MFVIYNAVTHRVATKTNGDKAMYSTMSTAKSQFNRVVAHNTRPGNTYAWKIDSYANFNATDPIVTVKHALTGADVQIRASERNGVCDPSTEHYHCM